MEEITNQASEQQNNTITEQNNQTLNQTIINQTNSEQINQENTTEQQEEQKPHYYGISFYGAAFPHIILNENQQQTDLFFDGPARNTAELFAKLNQEIPNKFITLLANDSLSHMMIDQLQKQNVTTTFTDFDNKQKQANLVDMNININVTNQQTNVTTNNTTNTTITKQIKNFTPFDKLAYKFLYPKFYYLNQSEIIYSDCFVNQNSIKALINNFNDKILLHVADEQNTDKIVTSQAQLLNEYLKQFEGKKSKGTAADWYQNKKIYAMAMNIQELFKYIIDTQVNNKNSYNKQLIENIKQINMTELLISNYTNQKKKIPYEEYLIQNNQKVEELFKNIIQIANCKQMIIFINEVQTLYIDYDDDNINIAIIEHSCRDSCIKSLYGNQEAFLAGFLDGIYQLDKSSMEDVLENGGYTQLANLKSYDSVNNKINKKYLDGLQQKYYVSIKIINYKDMSETKTEL